jgi:hypothetical protein
LPARLRAASPNPDDAACLFRQRFTSLRLFVDFTWLAYNFLKVVFVAFLRGPVEIIGGGYLTLYCVE